jgi:hypothetical protein
MSEDRRAQVAPQSAQPIQTQAVRSPFYRDAYTNNFRFRLGPSDFTITFGNNTELPGGGGILIQDEIGVSMSLPVLKLLALHLNRVTEAIENEIGAIKVPKKSLPTEQVIHALTRGLRDHPLTDA